MNERVDFLGIAFDLVPTREVEAWLASRAATSPYAYIVTPNVDHLVRLERAAPELRDSYRMADLCLCDSRVLATLARLCGVKLEVVTGSDLVVGLFKRILEPGDRVCVVGGTAAEARLLGNAHPWLDIVHHGPPMGLSQNVAARQAAAAFAAAAQARVTLFAVGSPQQELLAREFGATPGACGTALCIGASVDFLTGAQVRAPRLVQRLALEWAWRLAMDPRRLARRYLLDGPAIFPMVWRWQRARR